MSKKRFNILAEKNPTPRQLGIYMAAFLAVVMLFAMSFLFLMSGGQLYWWHIALMTLLIFSTAYGINIVALEKHLKEYR